MTQSIPTGVLKPMVRVARHEQ